MTLSPLFASFYQGNAKNLSGQECINLYADNVSRESKGTVGALYTTPGLTLWTTCGSGPVRGMQPLNSTQGLYVVSGSEVYEVSPNAAVMPLATINTSFGPVSMIQNGTQVLLVDGVNGWLFPGGYPLTGGTIQSGGDEYAVGDTLNLTAVGGQQTATAQITVTEVSPDGYPLTGGETSAGGNTYSVGDIITLAPVGGSQNTPASIKVTETSGGYGLTGGTPAGTMTGYAVDDAVVLLAVGGVQVEPAIIFITNVSAGAVTGFSVQNHGIFTVQPTSFVQAGTTGSGTGLTITSPTFSSSTGSQVAAFAIESGGSFSVQPTGFSQASTSGSGSGFTMTAPTFGALVEGGAITGFSVSLTGAFNPQPTQFNQNTTSGSGLGFVLTSPTYGAFANAYKVTLPFINPIGLCYQDGFGLLCFDDSINVAQSNLFDLSYWDPLNYGTVSADPNGIISLTEFHDQVLVLKPTSGQILANAGLPGFTFQTEPGVYMETGIAAQYSMATVGESVLWLARNLEGQGIVMEMTGYEPKKISTTAIENSIAGYPTMTDAIGYGVLINGHLFYVLNFPSGDHTWVFDLTTRVWHRWASFSGGQFHRHWSNCFTYANNLQLVGDAFSGNVYILDPNATTDNGTQRKWRRSWRAAGEVELFEPRRFNGLQIAMKSGIGVADGTNPQITLRWSDDDGYTWSNERFFNAGQVGQTGWRVYFKRLGSTTRTEGFNRIFSLSSTDVWAVGIYAADIT